VTLYDGVRLRSSPGTTTAVTILEELPKGAVLTATVRDSHAWRRVKAPSGNNGWVAEELIKDQ
jgi:SH3-like domain-containing protein